MRRRHKSREQLIAAVVAAWNDVQTSAKPDLMTEHADLYWAVAWLAAHETVAAERRWGR